MQNLGIIQGRLTPSEGRGIQFFPKAEWENEFPAAKGLGFENIEWVFDYVDYANNPLWTRGGCKKICNIIEQSGVAVHTVCFDYFMRRPFYKHLDDVALREENLRFFKNIADNLALVGGHVMELPLVDDAAIQGGDERGAALGFLRDASELAPPNLAVAIETDMPPGAFRSFLEDVGRNNVKANYDLGDSVGRGYDPWDEICSLGAYVENVHIKDKPLHGSTVALGKGAADFDKFFSALAYTDYRKGITLQVARGKDGKEKKYISEQIQFVKPFVEKYLTGGLKMKNVLGGGTPDSTDELPIGIMQGRLTPSNGRGIQFFPFGAWENEFSLGEEIGLDEIEWIFDYERHEENPLWTESGCQTIKAKIEETGVKVHSVCFDYFMRRPFYKGKGNYEENTAFFSRALDGMERIGASLIEVPLVDDSSIQTTEERKEALRLARDMADRAAQKKMVVGFETDMPPGIFRKFLEDIDRENVAANYDSGNSSGLGYDHREELLSLGTLVANVHIKDRVFQNGTVQLGTGSANFEQVFSSLENIGYQGSLILQAARGMDGDEKDTILGQMQFVEKYVQKYGLGA